jgi:4'-phosphopantetheinyl transferase
MRGGADRPLPFYSWRLPPESLALNDDEVHVWRAHLNVSPATVRNLLDTLAPDERARAGRFRFEKDRSDYIVARGVLRAILSRYLRVAPAGIRFAYSHYGKPTLAAQQDAKPLRFNLSHSHGLALYGVTLGREIGIDVEYVRPEVANEQIAERFFSTSEVAQLRSLSPQMQSEAFFNCWTRKEAYVKAHGEGLSYPLDKFDVSFVQGEPAALVATRPDAREALRWSVKELKCKSRYVASLVVEGQARHFEYWQWPPDG